MREFDRITFDPNIMGGRACIRGMRITVSLVLNLVANGMSSREIIEAYPYLEAEDIAQSLKYAAWLADEDKRDHPDESDDAWITEQVNKICAEEDTSLDPVIAAMQWATLKAADDGNELLRPTGLASGEFTVPDDFDDPLPEERIGMQVNELIRKAQTIVDCDGNKKAVQLDYATWEDLLELLEDIEDMEEMERIRESDGEYIPWEQAKIELRADGIDV